MRFQRSAKHAAFIPTERMRKAYARSVADKAAKLEQHLPLLAPALAKVARPVEEEMADRAAKSDRADIEARASKAAQWRKARAEFYSLPVAARRAVREAWNGHRWMPKVPSSMDYMIRQTIKDMDLTASDFPELTQAQRDAATAALNDIARSQSSYPKVRRRYAYSPGVMAWLAPGFVPDEEYDRPHVSLHTRRGLRIALHDQVEAYDAFGHNSDPSGLRACGEISILGCAMRFEILTRHSGASRAHPVTWNALFGRRVIWVGLANEQLDLAAATGGSEYDHERFL